MRLSGSLRRPTAFLGLLVALAVAGPPRAGQAQSTPSQAQIAWGQQQCDRADRLLAGGQATQALKLYKEVLKILPASPRARRGIAACQASLAAGARRPAAARPAQASSIKGTCEWSGRPSTWSATLTPRGDGTYDAVYTSSWGGTPLSYVGTIKTDRKSQISGNGRASGRGANGTFQFVGKYGTNGIAQCSYWEVGGSRKGSLTAELPR